MGDQFQIARDLGFERGQTSPSLAGRGASGAPCAPPKLSVKARTVTDFETTATTTSKEEAAEPRRRVRTRTRVRTREDDRVRTREDDRVRTREDDRVRTREDGPVREPSAGVASQAARDEVDDAGVEVAVEVAVEDAVEDAVEATEEDSQAPGDGPARRSRRRRGRRRTRRDAAGVDGEAEPQDLDAQEPADELATALAVADLEAVAEREHEPIEVDGAAPTRVQARAGRRGRMRSQRAGGTRPAGRAPLGGVSEQTRRAITEGPPRRMLVSVGGTRTQIAVLEERSLVEHYVTPKADSSYVGNIYLGRVQNVLPGMEAAFIDIGKGRNGVLNAGEVNYDEADLEGELPRIEQTLRPGQSVLVQVTKDPMGTKGARLTQHLSIAGRYTVLAPGDGMLGISRKLTEEERDRLRRLLREIKPDVYGLIVRTAAEGATKEQLEADVARLVRIWEQVQERAASAKPLDTVYEEPNLVIRVIRDVFGPEYTDLIVDSSDLAAQVKDYLAVVSPELGDRVSAYSGEDRLFDAYEVTNQIRRALEKKVWLASGGYLIIEKTEAMWVIDVNTGKFVGERNLEETVLRNNLEAAAEIARQLRLRDMGGIIVIDFVDMMLPSNRNEVLKRFKRELARDKTKSRVMEISKLGLVQMTRKNVSQGLQECFTTRCDCCDGRGAQIVEAIL
jgi:ribonuclease E